MKLEWIVERLKVEGEGTKKEVLNALENASADDLRELGVHCQAISIAMKICGVDKYCNRPKEEETDGKCS